MTGTSIFATLYIVTLAIWMLDSRALNNLRARSRYMRQFRNYEKSYEARMHAADIELAEMIEKEKQGYRRNSMIKHPSSLEPEISPEALEILNKVSKNIKNKNRRAAEMQKKIWPGWDEFKDLNK